MTSENELTTSSFLDQVIQALTVNDAPRLTDLLQMAQRVEAPTQEQEMLQAISRRQFLFAMLNETACNLRLLQRACCRGGEELRESYRRFQEIGSEFIGEYEQWPH